MCIRGKITIDKGTERQQAAILIVGKLIGERIQNGTLGTRQLPSLVVAAMCIGEDVARLVVFGVSVTVNGQPKVYTQANQQAQGKSDGNDPK